MIEKYKGEKISLGKAQFTIVNYLAHQFNTFANKNLLSVSANKEKHFTVFEVKDFPTNLVNFRENWGRELLCQEEVYIKRVGLHSIHRDIIEIK